VASLWKYGSRLFASGFLDVAFSRLDIFLIGKIFQPATLGYYTRAQSVDLMVRQVSATSITSVLFPHISRHQDDRKYLADLFVKYMHLILFISLWLSGVLFLTADYLFTILFSSRWSYSGELFQIMAIGSFIWPVSNLMCSFIIGVGNSRAFFRLEVIKKLLILPIYVFAFFYGIKTFIIFLVVYFYITLLLNMIFVSREIGVHVKEQVRITSMYFFPAVIAATISFFIFDMLRINGMVLSFFYLSFSFTILYILLNHLLKLKGLSLVMGFIQKVRIKLE
jgi:O-antigen/teichoic acid export membrane protein